LALAEPIAPNWLSTQNSYQFFTRQLAPIGFDIAGNDNCLQLQPLATRKSRFLSVFLTFPRHPAGYRGLATCHQWLIPDRTIINIAYWVLQENKKYLKVC